MKRAVVVLAVFLVLCAVILPDAAWARGGRHGGHGWHHGHGGWWWPGAIVGGLTLGVAAAVTAPFWALSAAAAYPPVVYAPPVTYAPTYYAAPAYAAAPTYAPPPAVAVQREVVYPNGRYLLYGDGVRQAWQWVWVPSAPPPPAPPAPPQ
jgi:hypothetical protein